MFEFKFMNIIFLLNHLLKTVKIFNINLFKIKMLKFEIYSIGILELFLIYILKLVTCHVFQKAYSAYRGAYSHD